MSNVIDFTQRKLKADELKASTDSVEDEALDEFIIDTSLDLTYQIIEALFEEGFEVQNSMCANDLVLVVEAIKGLMYRSASKTFPTQELARIIFEIKDPEQFIEEFFNYE